MIVNKDAFFREATLQLCGYLDFGDALFASLKYLRKHMPVDRLFLQFYDRSLDAMRIVADATPEGGSIADVIVPLSETARQEMQAFGRELKRQPLRHVWLFDKKPYDKHLTREIAEFNRFRITSLMVMPLGLSAKRELVGHGSIVLITEGRELFTREHVEALSLLKEPFAVAMSNALRHRESEKLRDRLADDNRQLQRDLMHLSGDEIIGGDFGLRHVMEQVRKVSPTESPVLLSGETGVGKDVIANAIHLGSSRRDGPFIPVNCGAIPESLLDSELFGHEKGAFSGALSRKRGRFERADKGTVFLDEIGEMPLEAQVRLLRVLQHREIERVGGTDRIPVDIRIIAATNKDLSVMAQEDRFRQDLFFRLNVFPITIPPLRERTCDIPALVQYFIERKAGELKIGGTPELAAGAMDVLMGYAWPGNVRELENVIERAVIVHGADPLRFDDSGVSLTGCPSTAVRAAPEEQILDLDTFTARHIRRVLKITNGQIHGPGGAGELLKVNPNTVRYKMRKLGIAFQKQKPGSKP